MFQIVPILFNLYTGDIPVNCSRRFIYADDIILSYQHKHIQQAEEVLTYNLAFYLGHYKPQNFIKTVRAVSENLFTIFNKTACKIIV